MVRDLLVVVFVFFSTLSIKAEIQLYVSRTCKLDRLAEITGVRNPFQFHLEAHNSCLRDSQIQQSSVWRRCPGSWCSACSQDGLPGSFGLEEGTRLSVGLACLVRGP